jgi:hypothetical protein
MGLVVAAMVAEVVVKNNLAGKEHLASIAAVLVALAVLEVRGRRRGHGSRGGTRSGAPPIRS